MDELQIHQDEDEEQKRKASFFNIHGFEKNVLIKWNQNGTVFDPTDVMINYSACDGGWTWRNNKTCFQRFLKANEDNGLVSYVVKLGLKRNHFLVIGFKPFTGVL